MGEVERCGIPMGQQRVLVVRFRLDGGRPRCADIGSYQCHGRDHKPDSRHPNRMSVSWPAARVEEGRHAGCVAERSVCSAERANGVPVPGGSSRGRRWRAATVVKLRYWTAAQLF